MHAKFVTFIPPQMFSRSIPVCFIVVLIFHLNSCVVIISTSQTKNNHKMEWLDTCDESW